MFVEKCAAGDAPRIANLHLLRENPNDLDSDE
jgi:hypothetical protein